MASPPPPPTPAEPISKRANLAFGSAATVNVGAVATAGTIVTRAVINVSQAFNGTASVSLGDAGNPTGIAPTSEIYLNEVGVYVIDCYFPVATGGQVIATYTAGGATTGAANIELHYTIV